MQTVQRIHAKGLIPFYLNNLPEYALRHSGEMHPYVQVIKFLKMTGISSENAGIVTIEFYPLAFFTNLKVYVVCPNGPWSEGWVLFLKNCENSTDDKLIDFILKEKLKYFLIPTEKNPRYYIYKLMRQKIPLFSLVEQQKTLQSIEGLRIKFILLKKFEWYILYKVEISFIKE